MLAGEMEKVAKRVMAELGVAEVESEVGVLEVVV